MTLEASTAIPSIYDAFNARSLEPHQVAQTFVPSEHYATLVKQAHTLIIGPRGSGKTTLLKMLQQPALEAWSHPSADAYRKQINFSGVFIATDRTWREQMVSLDREIDHEQHRLLSTAAFTTHVLRAVVLTIEQRLATDSRFVPHRRVTLDPNKESFLVREIASQWLLKPSLPTVLSLKYSLSSRLSEIYQLSSREAVLGVEGRADRLANAAFLHLDFLASAAQIIEIFDDAIGEKTGRWAFLFDELELAPEWILTKLVQSLRSVNEKFLFKLSMSPFSKEVGELKDALSASPDHDFDAIPLWYAHKEDGYEFCKALFESMVLARGLPLLDPDQLLGRSEFDTPKEEWTSGGTAYRPGTRLQKRFARMAEKDRSFANYLRDRGIETDFRNVLAGDVRAADIRKITSVVAVRDEFRAYDVVSVKFPKKKLRSRKNPVLYAGANSLFAISEGNPRWLKGILSRLLSESRPDGTVSGAVQATEIMGAAHRFRAMLKTIPCPPLRAPALRGLLSLLDRIGNYFFKAVVLDEFAPEPPLTFIVDARTDPEMVEALGRALNAGAIVYVPETSGEMLLGTVRGKRFRLAYLLAPYFQIPLILGKPVSLASILNAKGEAPLFDEVEVAND